MLTESTLYDRVGGDPWFRRLVERFYSRVEQDPVLRPLYPEDLLPARRHLALFLAQYWGGPPAYEQLRGHPRLRRRHAPFAIGSRERDAWIEAMTAAIRDERPEPADEQLLTEYFESAATALVNQSVQSD